MGIVVFIQQSDFTWGNRWCCNDQKQPTSFWEVAGNFLSNPLKSIGNLPKSMACSLPRGYGNLHLFHRELPSRELAYPLSRHFSRWYSFSQSQSQGFPVTCHFGVQPWLFLTRGAPRLWRFASALTSRLQSCGVGTDPDTLASKKLMIDWCHFSKGY